MDDAYPYVDLAPLAPGAPPRRVVKTAVTRSGREVLADRILVSFAHGTSDADIASINQQAAKLGAGAATPVLKLRSGSYLVDVSGADSIEAAAAAYRAADRRVTGASPDSIVRGQEDTQPDDPVHGWHLDKIQAPAAWDRTHGDGVTIAILDSGIRQSHPDLAGKVDDGTNVLWFSSGTDDEGGHGTGVAGIAAAATNNGLGIAGVGFKAHLLAVKVLYDSTKGPPRARRAVSTGRPTMEPTSST